MLVLKREIENENSSSKKPTTTMNKKNPKYEKEKKIEKKIRQIKEILYREERYGITLYTYLIFPNKN